MAMLLEKSLGMIHPLFPLYLGLLPERDDKPVIEFEQCNYRNNIYLPVLYDAIVTRHMVTFDYCSFDKPAANVTFSPYYLKEYNRRWFVYGHTEKSTGDASRERYSLDRIKNLHKKQSPLAPKPQKDYAALSKDLIGVSDSDYKRPVDVIIETLNPKIHGLIVSKPFHPSQKVLEPFHEDTNKGYPHGTIILHIRPNPEMYGKLLYYSNGVKVVGSEKVYKGYLQKIQSTKNTNNVNE
jgi:predicted DNA-binding transcriptional regulator YafY